MFILNFFVFLLTDRKLNIAVFSNTKKKNRKLLIRGFEFVVDRQLKQSTNWRCSRYKSAHCKARATTRINAFGVEHFFLRNPQHTHSSVIDIKKEQPSSSSVSASTTLTSSSIS